MSSGGWKITSVVNSPYFVDFNIELNLVLINSSSQVVNMVLFGQAVSASLKNCFEIKYRDIFYEYPKTLRTTMDHLSYMNALPVKCLKTVRTHLKVNWRVARIKQNFAGEHLIEIKNAADLPTVYGKVNKIYGSEIYINVSYVRNIISGYDKNTIPHEVGHSLGLLHPDINAHWLSDFGFENDQYWNPQAQLKDTNNVMFSGKNRYMKDNLSTHITPAQIKIAIQNIRENLVNQ